MSKIDSWVTKVPRLKNSKVARFSYRAEAYANDDIEGVDSYDYARDMNVPLATHTDFDTDMLSIGARTNFSSVPKNGLNHFFGRVSYNLNKVIDFLSDFLDDFRVQGIETLRRSANFTLGAYDDGKKLRIANIHTTNTITCTLPSGITYAGAITSFTLKPYEKIEIELFGTEWDEIGNEGIGTIKATGSTTADFGRLLCQGQALSRTTYARLFNRIGTAFGAGDGSTTFNLPDCREVALVGAGTNVLNSGQIVTHNAMTMASFKDSSSARHNHQMFTFDPSNGLKIGLAADSTFKHWGYSASGDPFALIQNFDSAHTKHSEISLVHGKQLAINYQIKY